MISYSALILGLFPLGLLRAGIKLAQPALARALSSLAVSAVFFSVALSASANAVDLNQDAVDSTEVTQKTTEQVAETAASAVSAKEFKHITVAELLNSAAESHRNLNYTGIVTYQADDRLKSFRIHHSVKRGEVVEHLQPLDSDSGEPLTLDHSIGCVHPGHQLLKYYASLDKRGDSQNTAALQLSRLYNALYVGETMVAGRQGNEFVLQAQDPFRLSYRMVLDSKSSLLLRSELLSPNGIVIERFQYMLLEELPAESIAEAGAAIKQAVTHSKPIAVAKSRQMMLSAAWQPTWLPVGFLLADMDENPAEGMSFTDGLAMFTLFVEPLDVNEASAANDSAPKPSVMRRGATLAYTQATKQNGAQYRVTAVGEVPLATLQQVVQSLKLVR